MVKAPPTHQDLGMPRFVCSPQQGFKPRAAKTRRRRAEKRQVHSRSRDFNGPRSFPVADKAQRLRRTELRHGPGICPTFPRMPPTRAGH